MTMNIEFREEVGELFPRVAKGAVEWRFGELRGMSIDCLDGSGVADGVLAWSYSHYWPLTLKGMSALDLS